MFYSPIQWTPEQISSKKNLQPSLSPGSKQREEIEPTNGSFQKQLDFYFQILKIKHQNIKSAQRSLIWSFKLNWTFKQDPNDSRVTVATFVSRASLGSSSTSKHFFSHLNISKSRIVGFEELKRIKVFSPAAKKIESHAGVGNSAWVRKWILQFAKSGMCAHQIRLAHEIAQEIHFEKVWNSKSEIKQLK